MKGFGIYVKNDLLEPKHYKNMGEAIWLYMWLLDKVTSINENGEGKVLGNKPIKYEDVNVDIGISRPTYARWVDKLRAAGYINTLRTPAGLVVIVHKAKKGKSDVSNVKHQKQSDVSQMDSDVSKTDIDVSKSNIQYKTKQGLNKDKTNTYVKPATPASRTLNSKEYFAELVKALGFTDKVRPTDGRIRKMRVRLKTYKPNELLKAARGLRDDAFMQGDNPSGKVYGNIDYLLRNDEIVEKYLSNGADSDNSNLAEELKRGKFN
jgi:DNA-binding MarR family transcriptional regulator